MSKLRLKISMSLDGYVAGPDQRGTQTRPDMTKRPMCTVLEGQDHGAPADVVAPVVAEFLAA